MIAAWHLTWQDPIACGLALVIVVLALRAWWRHGTSSPCSRCPAHEPRQRSASASSRGR